MSGFNSEQSDSNNTGLIVSIIDRLLGERLDDQEYLDKKWDLLPPPERYIMTSLAKQLFPDDLPAQQKVIHALLLKDSVDENAIADEVAWCMRLVSLFSAPNGNQN